MTDSTAWHAYIGHYESIHAVNVMAPTATLAAVEAARATGIAGQWTVIHGAAVQIEIADRRCVVNENDRRLQLFDVYAEGGITVMRCNGCMTLWRYGAEPPGLLHLKLVALHHKCKKPQGGES